MSPDRTLSHASPMLFWADDEVAVFAFEEEVGDDDADLFAEEDEAPASQRETLPAPPSERAPATRPSPGATPAPRATFATFVGLCAAGWAAAAAVAVLVTDAPVSVLLEELARALR